MANQLTFRQLVALTELGELLHRLMRLDDMPAVQWRPWVDAYRGHAR